MSVKFAIVEFLNSNEGMAIVPLSWLNNEEDLCSWPRCGTKLYHNVTTLVSKLQAPLQDWVVHKVRVLGKARKSSMRFHEYF